MSKLDRRSNRLNEKAKDASNNIQESIAGLVESVNKAAVQRALYDTIQIVEKYSFNEKILKRMIKYKRLL